MAILEVPAQITAALAVFWLVVGSVMALGLIVAAIFDIRG